MWRKGRHKTTNAKHERRHKRNNQHMGMRYSLGKEGEIDRGHSIYLGIPTPGATLVGEMIQYNVKTELRRWTKCNRGKPKGEKLNTTCNEM